MRDCLFSWITDGNRGLFQRTVHFKLSAISTERWRLLNAHHGNRSKSALLIYFTDNELMATALHVW